MRFPRSGTPPRVEWGTFDSGARPWSRVTWFERTGPHEGGGHGGRFLGNLVDDLRGRDDRRCPAGRPERLVATGRTCRNRRPLPHRRCVDARHHPRDRRGLRRVRRSRSLPVGDGFVAGGGCAEPAVLHRLAHRLRGGRRTARRQRRSPDAARLRRDHRVLPGSLALRRDRDRSSCSSCSSRCTCSCEPSRGAQRARSTGLRPIPALRQPCRFSSARAVSMPR